MTVKPISGQPSSAEVRAQLAKEGKPVLLAFSRGKDAIATWLALRDAGVKEIIPYHLAGATPDLKWPAEDLARWESVFNTKIITVPHATLLRRLNALSYQTADRAPAIFAADAGHFNKARADRIDAPSDWSEAHGDTISQATGSQWVDETLYRTAGGGETSAPHLDAQRAAKSSPTARSRPWWTTRHTSSGSAHPTPSSTTSKLPSGDRSTR